MKNSGVKKRNEDYELVFLNNRYRRERHELYEKISSGVDFRGVDAEEFVKGFWSTLISKFFYVFDVEEVMKLNSKQVIISSLDYKMVYVNWKLARLRRKYGFKLIGLFGDIDSNYYKFKILKYKKSFSWFLFLLYKKCFIDFLNAYVAKRCDSYVSYSEMSDEYLIEKYGISKDRIFTGTQFVDLDVLKAKKYVAGGIGSKLKLVFLGRIIEDKGIQNVVEVVSKFDFSDDIELHLIGKGPFENELVRMSDRKGVNVVFHGFKSGDDKAKIMKDCDVFILPSYFDSWGFVVNEAMACGLPCIVTSDVAAKEMVEKGCGFVYDVFDLDRLSEIIRNIYEDRKILNGMSKKSVEIISKNQLDKSIGVFRSAINYVRKNG